MNKDTITVKIRAMSKLVAGAILATAITSASALTPPEQLYFDTPHEAADHFVLAVARNDIPLLKQLLGSAYRSVLPLDELNSKTVELFLNGWANFNSLNSNGENIRIFAVGRDGWTLPIPIVRSDEGWHFDTVAGQEMMRIRRIGRNELGVMRSLRAYKQAQQDYASLDRDGDKLPEYARHFISSPGKRDGLYWPVQTGEPQSPLGPLFAEVVPVDTYHGYHYRILTAQGPQAPGGAYDYISDGSMTQGFAVIAWPAQYGQTGVKSFILSRESALHEADLGPDGDELAKKMSTFNPDERWVKVLPGFIQ